MIIIALSGTLILLLASCFFAASETALVSLSPEQTKSLALNRPRLAGAFRSWLVRPHELLIVILFGNTVSNVLYAAFATSVALRLFPSMAHGTVEFYAWLGGTVTIVIVGEMVPKFFARANPQITSLWVLPALAFFRRLLKPILALVSDRWVPLLPSRSGAHPNSILTFSPDELQVLLEEHQEGTLQQNESIDMLQRVLDLNNRTVESIMTPLNKMDIIELDPQGKPQRGRELLLDLIVESGHTRTPVKQGGEFIGFFYTFDLLPLVSHDKGDDILKFLRTAMDVAADQQVSRLLNDFRSSGVHIAFVRGADQSVVGLVTLEDVMEEITGEILDEYDIAG